ncbi:MAG: pyridoxal-phosphate dependent enzyme [Planctomycetes bacterium]|nr:pyridoxal-phosphate dependent enzyme [Planctomycetota bacterium]
MIYGPTFDEMLHPETLRAELRKRALAALTGAPLDPVSLYNITWKDAGGGVRHLVVPRELTGLDATIVLMTGSQFPTGSHKVGAVYSILIEKQLDGETVPGRDTIVCPSTGNYGIGGAWVGPRMGYRSLVVLPEGMSAERFEKIRAYGAELIKTPGCESNVKEIFDKVKELRRDPKNRILEQFSEFGNYRFHYHVTGNSAVELAADLGKRGVGNGRIAAFVSAMGSGGTIAAGDRIKQVFPEAWTVGVEPVQCPTLFNAGFGGHRIEGIGDKHVTWIHNVLDMDLLCCVDDLECLKGLQLIQEAPEVANARALVGMLGISGVCNVLGAIKTARHLRLRGGDVVVTVATDGFDRYPSVMKRLTEECGAMDGGEARRRLAIFREQKTDWMMEGTRETRRRWHNQKYYTWVEQQGKSVEDLRAQEDPGFWRAQQERIPELDRRLRSARGT